MYQHAWPLCFLRFVSRKHNVVVYSTLARRGDTETERERKCTPCRYLPGLETKNAPEKPKAESSKHYLQTFKPVCHRCIRRWACRTNNVSYLVSPAFWCLTRIAWFALF